MGTVRLAGKTRAALWCQASSTTGPRSGWSWRTMSCLEEENVKDSWMLGALVTRNDRWRITNSLYCASMRIQHSLLPSWPNTQNDHFWTRTCNRYCIPGGTQLMHQSDLGSNTGAIEKTTSSKKRQRQSAEVNRVQQLAQSATLFLGMLVFNGLQTGRFSFF